MNTSHVKQVPVLYVRGTNYEVGVAIGRTFASLIKDFLGRWSYFKDVLLPTYVTEEGRTIFDQCLTNSKTKFPLYVQEMQGMADGSGVPFHQIFLLHIESLIAKVNSEGELVEREVKGCTDGGCTDILCNKQDVFLTHTEDALDEMRNCIFIVDAHIVDEDGNTLEDFSSLTYPGYLTGYTMGYNRHGIIHSINTVLPAKTFPDRTPVYFITRALLAAKDKEHLLEILKDHGTGIGDGFSLNVIFAKEEVVPTLYNIEIGPNQNNGIESEVNIFEVQGGCNFAHCNKYLRLNVPEQGGQSWRSSDRRHAVLARGVPNCLEEVKEITSDYPIFRIAGTREDSASTLAIGIFDVRNMTWSIYTNPPKSADPVVVLPLRFNK